MLIPLPLPVSFVSELRSSPSTRRALLQKQWSTPFELPICKETRQAKASPKNNGRTRRLLLGAGEGSSFSIDEARCPLLADTETMTANDPNQTFRLGRTPSNAGRHGADVAKASSQSLKSVRWRRAASLV